MTAPLPTVELTAIDLAAALKPTLTRAGFDIGSLSDDPVQIADLFNKITPRDRDMVCEYIALRAGRRAHDWPKWLDQVHDDALHDDAIDANRKTLADHLAAIISEIAAAQRARQELQGQRGSATWDVEHAEGGTQFEYALNQLAFLAAAAQALNPTRDL